MEEKEKIDNEKIRQGKVIKIIESLDFGVIETEDSEFLFFHISNFEEEDLTIEDIKVGDVIMCEAQTQKSDGRQAAINCRRVEIKGFLKDYFIENALTAPGDVELFDDFCENTREYASYIVDADIDIDTVEDIKNYIFDCEELMKLKMIRPQLAVLSNENSDNKTFAEFMMILDEIIKKIDPKSEDESEFNNLKKFLEILLSYIKAII